MKAKLKNLLSRKFLLTLAVVVGGIGTCLKATDDPTLQIAGIIVACIAASVYSFVEGECDVASIESAITQAVEEIETIQDGKTEEVENNE